VKFQRVIAPLLALSLFARGAAGDEPTTPGAESMPSGGGTPDEATDSGYERKAQAELLFEKARALLERDAAAEACPLLEQSQRLDPATGTLLFLGDCFARTGRTASAWAAFREAEARAKIAGQVDREELARARSNEVSARVPRLLVSVGRSSRVSGLRISCDGKELGSSRWNDPMPLDPGTHVISARAPGRLPFTTTVELPAQASEHVVEVPALSPEPPRAAATEPREPRPRDGRPARKTSEAGPRIWTFVGVAGIAAGGTALAIAAFSGMRSFDRWDDARAGCDRSSTPYECNESGLRAAQDAESAAALATWATIGGAALVAGGSVILIVDPGGRAESGSNRVALGWVRSLP
jgi:hypothetical protein